MGLTRDVRASRGLTAFGTLLVTTTFAACEVSSSGLDLPEQLIDGITYRVTGFVIAESFPFRSESPWSSRTSPRPPSR